MIFLPPSSSTTQTALHYSTKRTDIQAIEPILSSAEGEYCRCLRQCIRPLPAFTDEIGDDYFNNDLFSMYFNPLATGTLEIRIFKDGSEVALVTDNSYGFYLPMPFATVGYEFQFYLIWAAFGYGTYSFRIDNLSGSGVIIQTLESPKFNLQKYTEQNANNTVRIETLQNGKLQHGVNYLNPIPAFKRNYPQQIRFYGSLKLTGNVIENDTVLSNNSSRTSIQIKDQLYPEFELTLQMPGAEQSFLVIYDYLFAETVKISDYNIFNFVHQPNKPGALNYRSIPVKRTGIEFNASKKARRKTFKISMEYDNKNVFKTNC